MALRDTGMPALLAALAAYVWAKTLPFLAPLENTLPILLALPLFGILGGPWRWKRRPQVALSLRPLTGIAAFIAGAVADSVTMLSAAWTYLLWIWISDHLDAQDRHRVRKLLVLPLLSFPWLYLEGGAIGWYFRLTGAWVASHLFGAAGLDVAREGTGLIIRGMPLDIGEACSGINTLQSMLIAGTVLNFHYLGKRRAYWWNIPALFVLSWLANTTRIVILCAAALRFGHEFASGLFHTAGGWSLLFMMMCASWGLFALEARYIRRFSPCLRA